MNELDLKGFRVPAPPGVTESVALDVGLVDGYHTYESPVGQVMVVFNERGVGAVELASDEMLDQLVIRRGRLMVEADPPRAWGSGIERALVEGRPGRLPIDWSGISEFRQKALTVTATIPFGQVRSYGWVAGRVGETGAARAVGSAMAGNPIPLIIPCHRVVRSDVHIGNYSLGGPEQKWTLLRSEGANPERLEDLATKGIRYLGSDTTGIFCLPTCRYERKATVQHAVEFRSPAEAAAAGYRPCKVCQPV